MAKTEDAASAEAQAKKAQEHPAPATKTPSEWLAQAQRSAGKRSDLPWQHAAAAQLHGWPHHEHHEGAPMQLTGEAYYGALVAVSHPTHEVDVLDAKGKPVVKDGKPAKVATGRYVPHFPALSKHAPIFHMEA